MDQKRPSKPDKRFWRHCTIPVQSLRTSYRPYLVLQVPVWGFRVCRPEGSWNGDLGFKHSFFLKGLNFSNPVFQFLASGNMPIQRNLNETRRAAPYACKVLQAAMFSPPPKSQASKQDPTSTCKLGGREHRRFYKP